MTTLTRADLAPLTGGTWHGPPPADGPVARVGTDSREDLRGGVFVALRGTNHDGHDHLSGARAAGAVAALVERVPAGAPGDLPLLLVDDAIRALGQLGLAHRRRCSAVRVVAVTGSSGKTTTKRILHAVLGAAWRGASAPRSFNNALGVPLTLLMATPDDDYLVVEIGTSEPGEIAALAALVEPDVAVITNIGPAHLEKLGDLAGVAAEKASILDHVRPGGAAIVNVDRSELVARLPRTPAFDLVTFGLGADADLRLTAWGAGGGFVVGDGWRADLALPGRHHALDALAVVGVARALGLDDDLIRAALARLSPALMRGHLHRARGVVVHEDAYNANPDSMAASLETFVAQSPATARRVMVLGDMLELGATSAGAHEDLGRHLATLVEPKGGPAPLLVFVGPAMQVAAEAWRAAGGHGDACLEPTLDEEAIARIADRIAPGDAVLLKGSRSMRLERLVPFLVGPGNEPPDAGA